jgi:hypothetical protein
MTSYEDYIEDSTVREVHRIREKLSQQQKASGLSYFDWLKATEKDLKKSLAEVGFHMVTRNGRVFLHEIKPRRKSNNQDKTLQINKNQNPGLSSSPAGFETPKHKNYDDYIESSTMREIHRIQEKMEQEYRKSGLPSYDDWLQATEKDLQKSLAEVGYRMVKRGDRIFLDKIESQSKTRVKYKHKAVSKRNKTSSRKKSTK